MTSKEIMMRSWIIFVLMLFLLSGSVYAVSIGVSPGRIDYRNVLKGGYAERTITVTTDSTTDLVAHFEKEGDVADWIYLEPFDEFFSLSVNQPYKLKVIVEPPEDAQNGTHHGSLRFVTDRFGRITGRAGGYVKAAVQMDLNVQVTGTEFFSCRAGGFTVTDTEIGFPLEISATIVNDGNVRINPRITIDIWDQFQENLVLSTDFDDEEVLPTVTRMITKQINHNLPIGQYWMNINVGECNSGELLTFSVVEKGGIVDKGELVEINNKPWAYVGETVQFNMLFRNYGIRTVTAYFKGSIRKEDKIVQVVETEELDVASGSTNNFVSFFTPEDSGRYILSGRVVYNKKITYEKASVLNVNPVPREPSKFGIIQLLIYVTIIITILYLIRIIIKERKKR
jgi:hypothetical protein